MTFIAALVGCGCLLIGIASCGCHCRCSVSILVCLGWLHFGLGLVGMRLNVWRSLSNWVSLQRKKIHPDQIWVVWIRGSIIILNLGRFCQNNLQIQMENGPVEFHHNIILSLFSSCHSAAFSFSVMSGGQSVDVYIDWSTCHHREHLKCVFL